MSRNRTRKDAGWCDQTTLTRGVNGRALCRQCQTEVPKGRRTFCGDACVDAWRITTDPAFVRSELYKRDRGVCRVCGRDMDAIEKRADRLAGGWGNTERRRRVRRVVRRLFGIDIDTRSRWWWDADHVEAVQEGGGCCGLDGFQTLCVPCHREKTAQHAARRAGRRMATGQLRIPGVTHDALKIKP